MRVLLHTRAAGKRCTAISLLALASVIGAQAQTALEVYGPGSDTWTTRAP